jgi:hypothetical protein
VTYYRIGDERNIFYTPDGGYTNMTLMILVPSYLFISITIWYLYIEVRSIWIWYTTSDKIVYSKVKHLGKLAINEIDKKEELSSDNDNNINKYYESLSGYSCSHRTSGSLS